MAGLAVGSAASSPHHCFQPRDADLSNLIHNPLQSRVVKAILVAQAVLALTCISAYDRTGSLQSRGPPPHGPHAAHVPRPTQCGSAASGRAARGLKMRDTLRVRLDVRLSLRSPARSASLHVLLLSTPRVSSPLSFRFLCALTRTHELRSGVARCCHSCQHRAPATVPHIGTTGFLPSLWPLRGHAVASPLL
mgnify:CR=1 FL=1